MEANKSESEENQVEEEIDEEEQYNTEALRCRYYEKDFPEENELVVTKITEVQETGAYVVLLEYDGIEGLLPFTEITKRRVSSVKRLVRVGKQEIMMVVRVDKEKRYIDLSKKKVNPEEARTTEKFFKKAKVVHQIMKMTAHKTEQSLESIYERFGWILYKKFEHAYDAFRLAVSESETVFKDVNITEKEREALVENIKKRMSPAPVKIRGDFEITCFTPEGVDALKEALLTAKSETMDPNFDVKFRLIAPPHYMIETSTLDKLNGLRVLQEALVVVERVITGKKGNYKLLKPPQLYGGDKDDKDIEHILDEFKAGKEEDSSGAEDNREGMDIQLDGFEEEEKEEKKQDIEEQKDVESGEEETKEEGSEEEQPEEEDRKAKKKRLQEEERKKQEAEQQKLLQELESQPKKKKKKDKDKKEKKERV